MASTKAPNPRTTKFFSCLCGCITLSVAGVDKGTVACHCSNCQKFSGSSFAHNYRVVDANIEHITGEELVSTYADNDTKSGNTVLRHFCSKCGSPLYLTVPKSFPGLVILSAGTMQDRTQPSFELFKENKQAWIGDISISKPKL